MFPEVKWEFPGVPFYYYYFFNRCLDSFAFSENLLPKRKPRGSFCFFFSFSTTGFLYFEAVCEAL